MARNSGVDLTSSPSAGDGEETGPSPAEVRGVESSGKYCGMGYIG